MHTDAAVVVRVDEHKPGRLLNQAHALIESVKLAFLSGKRIESARLLNEIVHLLDDEIAALNKAIEDDAAAGAS